MKQKAVDFAVSVIDLIENINTSRKHYRLFEQIEASSTSIAMNIAEGKEIASMTKGLINSLHRTSK